MSTWVFWWEFNKDYFLNLKAKVRGIETTTDGASPLTGLGAGGQAANTLAPTQAQKQNLIVPALFALMESEDDRDIATGTMISLAKIGMRPEDARLVFRKHLDAPAQEVSETAALAFGIMQDVGAIPTLESLLRDTKEGQALTGGTEVNLRTRTFAAYSLALIGHQSESEEVKLNIADTLYDVLVTDSSSIKDIRVACVIGIGVLDLPDATDMVRKLSQMLEAKKMDQLVLAHLPNAMAKLLRKMPAGDATRDAAIDQFIGILRDKKRSTAVRQSTIQAVGMIAIANDPRNRDIYDILVHQQKKGGNQQVKHFTAISMAYLGVAAPDVRPDVTKFLVDKMKKSSTPYEPWCGLSLGVMVFLLQEKGEAIEPFVMEATLAKFNKEKSPDPKAAYAIALGLMKNEAAKGDIRAALEKSSVSSFRGYAAISLGLLNGREYLGYIGEVVDNAKRDPDLLKQASIGLGLMKDRNAVGKLLEFLDPTDGRPPRLAVLSAVATALGFIGEKSSVQPLVDTMTNERLTDLGRAFASVSLGMVADKDDMPWNSVFGQDLNYRAAVSTLIDQQTGTGILDIH
ncbi:MAG: HEAT repeat domain-containing protein [Planctomycetota bacterium]